MLRLSVRLELCIIKYIFAYWKFVKYNQNYQGEKLRHTAEWKSASKKPKIKKPRILSFIPPINKNLFSLENENRFLFSRIIFWWCSGGQESCLEKLAAWVGLIKHIGLKPLFLVHESLILCFYTETRTYFKNLVSLKMCQPPFKQEPV